MPSVRRIVLLVACALLVASSLGGCQTTQDTAARKQAESKRILEAREHKERDDRPK